MSMIRWYHFDDQFVRHCSEEDVASDKVKHIKTYVFLPFDVITTRTVSLRICAVFTPACDFSPLLAHRDPLFLRTFAPRSR